VAVARPIIRPWPRHATPRHATPRRWQASPGDRGARRIRAPTRKVLRRARTATAVGRTTRGADRCRSAAPCRQRNRVALRAAAGSSWCRRSTPSNVGQPAAAYPRRA
jgi:hypothetical protein